MHAKKLIIGAVVIVTVLPIAMFFSVQRYRESVPYFYEAHVILGERDLREEIETSIEQDADFTAEFGESKVGHIHWVSEGVRFEIGSTRKNDVHDPKDTRVTGIFSVNGNLLNQEEKLGIMLKKMNKFAELFPELQGKRYYYRQVGGKRYQDPPRLFDNGRLERFEIDGTALD